MFDFFSFSQECSKFLNGTACGIESSNYSEDVEVTKTICELKILNKINKKLKISIMCTIHMFESTSLLDLGSLVHFQSRSAKRI